jgi:site-specific DNA-methyltransferase (adenine-specific)
LIEALGLGRNILDPFCGCGSMLVGAAARGRTATGIDINPLATFTARVKSQPLTTEQVAEVRTFCSEFPDMLRMSASDWLPDLSIARKVFEPDILDTLLKIRDAIQTANLCGPSTDFLRLCWVAILETVGSYFKEGNGIKYRNVQRRPGKYVSREDGVWQRRRFGDNQSAFVIRAFTEHLRMMLADTALWGAEWGRSEVIEGNALELSRITRSRFDSIVFSPPYANRFDYFESLKVELWFGGFVRDKLHMKSLRKGSLRSHLSSDFSRPQERFEVLERLIDCMDRSASSWRMGVPNLLRGYFSDIVEVLRQCRERLQGGACYVVVGNSAFGGTIIPSDALTAIAGERAGFKGSELWVTRHLTVAPQQRAVLAGYESFMRESVVVLRP